MFALGLLVACGGREPDEYPEPPPTPYEVQNYDYLPEPIPIYVSGIDHYDIRLTVDPVTRIVSGISSTTFTNRTGEPLETIVLRVFLNAFDEGSESYFPELEQHIFRYGPSYGHMDILHVTMNNEDLAYDLTGTILILHPEEPLIPGETVHLVMQYSAYIPTIAHRTGANDKAMWFGMFLPVLAVFGEDGWITPEYYPAGAPFVLGMASFEVEIITPVDYIVAGTGVMADEITLTEADTRVAFFTASNARSFAFAISPYFKREHIATDGGDIHLYYYTDSLPIDNIIDIISASMEFLSARIGQYPFDHIRIVETDMFVSGVAFSNIIFVDTVSLSQPDAEALTRMLGQQWFSNIVGSNPVTESWLDRGLVRYITASFFYDQPVALREHMMSEYALLASREDLYLQNRLGDFDNWHSYFQTHHVKSSLMFYSLNNIMGDELFWELVRQYFEIFYFQIGTGADFMDLAEEIYGESLEDFFSEWFAGGAVPTLRLQNENEDGLIP